jgi:HEAT repeat protein
VEDLDCPGHHGAFAALRQIGHPSSAPVLIARFTDDDPRVRQSAKEAFAGLPREVQLPKLDYLFKVAADSERSPLEVDPDDPLNAQLEALVDVLFSKNGLVTKDFAVVDRYSSREAFREAFRAAATIPSGTQRKSMKYLVTDLPKSEAVALGETLLDLIRVRAPADRMFSGDIRRAAVRALLRNRIAEGIPASVELYHDGSYWARMVILREWSKIGPSIMDWEGEAIREVLEEYDHKVLDKDKTKLAEALKTKPKVEFTSL